MHSLVSADDDIDAVREWAELLGDGIPGLPAHNNCVFPIFNGEFFVLLGPTGAGKTTTLRIISGLEQPDRGNIFFDEELMNDVQPAFRDTSYVFQQFSLYPHYSVYDNLAFPLRSPLRKESKIYKLILDPTLV